MTREKLQHTTFGTHEAWFVEPDELRFLFRGEFNESHVDPYLNFLFAQADRVRNSLYAAYELSAFVRITEGGRKGVVRTNRPYPLVALAAVGASFSTQVFAKMVLTAGRLIVPKHFEFPIKFFPIVSEAEAWFDELRLTRARLHDKG